MNYQLAQLNLAKFREPQDDPVNKDFVDNLARVNRIAEQHKGFVWRFVGDSSSVVSVRTFGDPNIIINLSVWTDIHSLVDFVYRNKAHKEIMRRRNEWFEKMEFFMVLWWIEEGRVPTLEESRIRLELLRQNGPTYSAFTFKQPFAAPSGEVIKPFEDQCA